jgi:RNA polymerase sigma-70 factor (ECF subfamily)
MPPLNSEETRWFEAHLRPHEPMLRAWLQGRFPDLLDLDDILQEAYSRVLIARERGPMQSPKAFLFATARNLALDLVRRRQVVRMEPLADSEALSVLDEADDIARTVARAEEIELMTAAIQSLPDRCRQIITLRKIYGMSQSDIAGKLGISEHTVSAQLTIGLNKLTDQIGRQRWGREVRP